MFLIESSGLLLPLTFQWSLSQMGLQSNTTLLLAGKRDWGERGEPRNAFHGELLTAGHSADVPIKVEVCEHVCASVKYCVSQKFGTLQHKRILRSSLLLPGMFEK